VASCLCHLQINAWEGDIGGGKHILHASTDTQPSPDQKHINDTTRVGLLLLDEINVLFDMICMRDDYVWIWSGPLYVCKSWILTGMCGFDLNGWATQDVFFHLRHALAGHLVGIVGGTHRDFVLNTALTFQMIPAISKRKYTVS